MGPAAAVALALAVASSPLPPPRPDVASPAGATAEVAPAPQGHRPLTAPEDMVCRDPRITGRPVAQFAGGIPGCGVFAPARVEAVSGVPLSPSMLADCRTARAFASWLDGVAQPAALELLASRIERVLVLGSYACRRRNSDPDERLSEHAAGQAVDFAGVVLADGRRVTVAADWGDGDAGRFLRRISEDACGLFTTVLGPEADTRHRGHLHLDTAWRDSTYCH